MPRHSPPWRSVPCISSTASKPKRSNRSRPTTSKISNPCRPTRKPSPATGKKPPTGVILISLRYDKPAIFEAGTTFDEYIAGQVKWDDDEPAARIILRYTVTPEGKAVLAQELESTDNRLKRRVLKALSEAPHWHPAQKNGVAVASEGVLHIQLPKGKRMPRPVELVWR